MADKQDPQLIAVKATISYKSDDGYESEECIGSLRKGVADPIQVLAATVREASRLLALFGQPERATEAASEALVAVTAWRNARRQKADANA